MASQRNADFETNNNNAYLSPEIYKMNKFCHGF